MCVINNLKPNVKYAFSVVGINAFGRSAPGRALTLLLVPYVDGSPQLTPPMIELLKGLAQEMVGGNFHNVTIEGYTSSTGSFALNQALGIRRGQVAAAQLLVYLAADGVSGISIKVIGKGDVVFLTPDHTNPTNRQTDITVN
jgi:outer membrane protein OmpA-like peptidoglycan-associated protein